MHVLVPIFYSSIPFYQNGLTLIPAWISNHMPSKVWDEITYPLPNFNGAVEVHIHAGIMLVEGATRDSFSLGYFPLISLESKPYIHNLLVYYNVGV